MKKTSDISLNIFQQATVWSLEMKTFFVLN
uniref:Uncharacterized protein n=1 Tax=Anguilla anguilla TaxID=7936 RepID=A0A0E9TVG7_ANGAN